MMSVGIASVDVCRGDSRRTRVKFTELVVVISMPIKRYRCARGAVLRVGAEFGLTSFGMATASPGETREPGGGRRGYDDERTVIHSAPDLFGRVKFPTNTAPAGRSITSPGCAAFSAA